jgi:uncharacterized protein (DUF342 family)
MSVELGQFRDYMQSLVNDIEQRKSVQVKGASLEEALQEAAIELGIPLKEIEFEVLVKGSKGTMGIGKRDFIIIAYEKEKPREDSEFIEEFGLEAVDDDFNAPKDSELFVRLTPQGVMFKATTPKNGGQKKSLDQAINELNSRAVHDFDKDMVRKIVEKCDNTYVKVGEFIYNPANDAIITIDIADYEMKAYLVIRGPGPGGADVDADTILSFLQNNSVVFGIKEDAIKDLEEHPVYDEPILIAEGDKPYNGKDARIIFNFETDRSHIKLKERNGRVDFKELNLVQNVVEGQSLARKMPAEQGENGRTVTGKLLPAKPGNDIDLPIGKNVKASDDKLSIIASINGQVILTGSKVNVEPVYVVPGDVNLKTGGNVIFLGTVMVKGNVDDGFKVKAAGNIEVLGNVGKCELDAEGDIIVHQGIQGKTGGRVHAGKGVYSKFIENATVEAGDTVMASDGIINSIVLANRRIICQGKRATIVGGHLTAAELIHAKTLGSVAGSETVLEVGFDPKKKKELGDLEAKRDHVGKDMDEIKLNLQTLENLKRQKNELNEEKQTYFDELTGRLEKVQAEFEGLENEIAEIQHYLASLKVMGKISASSKVFQGVKINIKDAYLEVRNEFKASTFINEANVVRVTKFEEIEEEEIPGKR